MTDLIPEIVAKRDLGLLTYADDELIAAISNQEKRLADAEATLARVKAWADQHKHTVGREVAAHEIAQICAQKGGDA